MLKERKRQAEEEAQRKEDEKKAKKGKKGATAKVKETIKAPEPPPVVEDEPWATGIWGSAAKKKGKKGKEEFEAPPPAPTPPAMGLTPEPEDINDDWGSFSLAKDKKSSKTSKSRNKVDDIFATYGDPTPDPEPAAKEEETPAKAARGFWGSMAGGTTKTSKLTKDKNKDEGKEVEKPKESELIDFLNEDPTPAPKPDKGKTSSKLSKTVSKTSDKSNAKTEEKKSALDALLDFDDEQDTSWDTKEVEPIVDSKAKDKKGTSGGDAWSFWGSSKKPAGKKEKETKEIVKGDSANQRAAAGSAEISELWSEEKTLEGTSAFADESTLFDSKLTKASSKMKSTETKSSVAERVKSLEKSKSKKGSDAKEKEKEAADEPTPPPPPPEPQPEFVSRKPSTATSKLNLNSSATKSASLSATKKKDLASTAPKTETKESKESVPGSFPDDIPEGDLLDIVDAPSSPPKKTKTKAVASKAKTKKAPEPEPEANMDDLLMDAPIAAEPLTPPPEPKPAKKERARIVKNEGASSWGFWGAAPKKTTKESSKSNADADVVSPSKEKPSLGRSKSTRTQREKEKEESRSSNGSDKDKKAEARSRPSRTNSFAGFFGGPPPARTKSVRRTSSTRKPPSRSESGDIAGSGMPSPPLDDDLVDAPEMNSKAAKLMGVGRKEGRPKARKSGTNAPHVIWETPPLTDVSPAVPDPYAIDDDDMVMVNPVEDPVINAPIPKREKREKLSRSKSKREVRKTPSGWRRPARSTRRSRKANILSRAQSKVMSDPADDIVMVDGPSNDMPEVINGPDDIAFVEKPRDYPGLKRSNTTGAKKSDGGGIMGLFGLRKSRPEPSRAMSGDEAYGGSRRKRSAVGPEDDAKRARRSRHTEKMDENEGFTTDIGPTGNNTEVEDAEARREARRARRDGKKEEQSREARRAELRELEERRARRQLNDKAATEARKAKIREAREQRARAEPASEEKTSRRSAPDAGEGDETVTETRPRKHRARETDDERRARRRSEKRTSNIDGPLPTRTAEEEAERRARREERHSSRRDKDKRKSSAPAEDYFDPRNGTNDPYAQNTAKGADKTSSWVNSQVLDPPQPPPIEGTVLEPEPVLGPDGEARELEDDEVIDEEEEKRRRRRAERRKSRADRVLGKEEASKRRRRAVDGAGQRSSEGSDGKDERERRRRAGSSGYGARPDIGNKRQSWFKKLGI